MYIRHCKKFPISTGLALELQPKSSLAVMRPVLSSGMYIGRNDDDIRHISLSLLNQATAATDI